METITNPLCQFVRISFDDHAPKSHLVIGINDRFAGLVKDGAVYVKVGTFEPQTENLPFEVGQELFNTEGHPVKIVAILDEPLEDGCTIIGQRTDGLYKRLARFKADGTGACHRNLIPARGPSGVAKFVRNPLFDDVVLQVPPA
jgi:hypothetical protein